MEKRQQINEYLEDFKRAKQEYNDSKNTPNAKLTLKTFFKTSNKTKKKKNIIVLEQK